MQNVGLLSSCHKLSDSIRLSWESTVMNKSLELAVMLLMTGIGWGNCLDSWGHRIPNSDEVSFGEISLEKHGYHLPAITLGISGHEGIDIEEWPGNSVFNWKKSLLPPWDYDVEIPKKFQDRVIPVVEEIGVPVVKEVPIKVSHLVTQTMPQPFPIFVPVAKPIPYEVVKHVYKTVEKKVPMPVEKIVSVPVLKHVPYQVERNIPVPIVKHVPIKVPVYKTIYHKG